MNIIWRLWIAFGRFICPGITTNAPITIPLSHRRKKTCTGWGREEGTCSRLPNSAIAEMIVAALEQVARDGETFILEDGKCK